MNKTNKEIWEEIVRTAHLLRSMEPELKCAEYQLVENGASKNLDFPVEYISDALILTELILSLDACDAKIN
jgi:hypothetical protein